MKEPSAAIITIFRASEMTKKGRREIAKWMRRNADFLERDGTNFSHRFTARYLYTAPELLGDQGHFRSGKGKGKAMRRSHLERED